MTLVLLPVIINPAQLKGEFICLYLKVFQVTRGAEVVCKGGAADVVGQMRLKLVFFGDEWCGRSRILLHADIAGGVLYREGKEMGGGRASLYWYLTCADP